MSNIVVTGATSFIGYHLINKMLLNKEFQVYAVIRPNSNKTGLLTKSDNLHFIELDMNDYDKIGNFVKNVDVLFHLSWNGTRIPQRDDEELQKTNFENSCKLCDSLALLGLKQIVLAGSQAEYGNIEGVITEDEESKPITPYGVYKVKLYEHLVEQYSNKLHIKEPRFFSLYGPGDYEETLIMSTVSKMLNNEEILLTDCKQMWDYLYIDDACEGLIALLDERIENGIYNFASGEFKQLKCFVEEIKRITNTISVIRYGAINNTRIVSFEPSIKKMQRNTNWMPNTSFETGIKEIIKKYNSCL